MRKILHYLLIASVAFVFACETESDKDVTNEVEKNKEQFPGLTNQKQVPEQDLKILKEFTPKQAKIKELVTEVIYRNLEATQAEDVDAVLETIHSESPQIVSTRSGMEFVFKNYDMVYEIKYLKFLEINNEEVQALYEQTTKAVKGTGFANTRSVGIHTLKKDKDGKWKIYKTEFVSSELIP